MDAKVPGWNRGTGIKRKRTELGKKLYVGNLSYDTTAESLRELFAPVGEVASATVISDRETQRSKGFGFVEMATDEAAAAAISQLNGKDVAGRNITVAEARPPSADGGGFRGGSSRGGPRRSNDREPPNRRRF
jgi:RNA recognition motif-containing protein